jgi:hypothetical protein
MATIKDKEIRLKLGNFKLKSVNGIHWIGFCVETNFSEVPLFNPKIISSSLNFEDTEHGIENLISIIRNCLENNISDAWELAEPDFAIEVYPSSFPFTLMERRLKEVHSEKNKRKSILNKKSPDDPFTIITMFDQCFVGNQGEDYGDSGPAVIISTDRKNLEKFVNEMDKEFDRIRKLIKIKKK